MELKRVRGGKDRKPEGREKGRGAQRGRAGRDGVGESGPRQEEGR